jgi:hypothetical protein
MGNRWVITRNRRQDDEDDDAVCCLLFVVCCGEDPGTLPQVKFWRAPLIPRFVPEFPPDAGSL